MKNRIKFLATFTVVFCVLTTLGFLIANQKFPDRNNYFLEDELLFGQHSKGDACSKSLYNDPIRAGNNYVKVNFYCEGDRSSKNTISLNVIKEKTVKSVLSEITRINSFELEDDFRCYIERKIIQNFDQEVFPEKTIDCLAPDIKINDIYGNKV